MNIGFDLDGVLYPWHESIYDYFVENDKFSGTYKEFWSEYWKKEDVQKDIGYLCSVPIFCENREPVSGAMSLLKKISKLGHSIFYITNRPTEVHFATWHYLDRHNFPDKENLYIVEDKATLARSIDLNLFLDDREKNIKEVTPVCLSVLRAQPWNVEFWDKYPTIHRLPDIMQFVEN